jgi:replication-associated recombination protein RarA
MSRELPPTRHGRSPYLVISALQKAYRRAQPEQAAAFAIELVQAGYGNWFWSRARVVCCEDLSPEATGLVADVAVLHQEWKLANGKGDLHLLAPARAAVALALAKKSRLVDWLVIEHAARDSEPIPIPDEAVDMHTREGRKLGRGRRHFADEAGRLVDWDGDLAALEADVRQRALARWLRDEYREQAPRVPDEGDQVGTSRRPAVGQLRIEPERGER